MKAMKAILINRHGFTREVALCPPPPDIIRMAVSDKSPTSIYGDMMPHEWLSFKLEKFMKKGPLDPLKENWLYVQEGFKMADVITGTTMGKFYDSLNPKLVEAIKKNISQDDNLLYKIHKTKDENEALALAATEVTSAHKAAFNYDEWTEKKMVLVAKDHPPTDTESAYDYLTRLFHIVNNQENLKQLEVGLKKEVPDPIKPKKRLMRKS